MVNCLSNTNSTSDFDKKIVVSAVMLSITINQCNVIFVAYSAQEGFSKTLEWIISKGALAWDLLTWNCKKNKMLLLKQHENHSFFHKEVFTSNLFEISPDLKRKVNVH